MTESKNTNSPYIYKLELKNRSKKSRTKEAIEKLKLLYPYEIKEQNLLIKETNERNNYDVIISDKGFRKGKGEYKWIVIIILILIVVLISVIVIGQQIKIRKNNEQEEKLIELQNEQKIQESKSKKIKLEGLLKEIEKYDKEKYENVYSRIELLYFLLDKLGTVENLSLDGDSFLIDVTSKDSVQLLENFELSKQLTKVKMVRTTVDKGIDYVSLSGMFMREFNKNDENLSLEQQISSNDEILSNYKRRKIRQNQQNLSDYIKVIRDCVRCNGCREQYLQVKGEKNNLEVELMFYSYAKEALSFIKEIQNQDNDLVDIKKLQIRNSQTPSKVQTNITFVTGIDIKENTELVDTDKRIYDFSPNEISLSLYKEPAKVTEKNEIRTDAYKDEKSVLTKESENKPVEYSTVKKEEIIRKYLDYIGLTKFEGKSYILAKDNQMNVIYKFEIAKKESEGNVCYINENGKYIAKLNSELYEVKK